MTTRTRYFMIASLLVLTVGLGTGLLAYYVGFPTSAFSGQGGPEELQLVPADASLVAFADVREIMTSPLRDRLRALLPGTWNGPREFADHTGINIETDVDRVIVAVTPTREASSRQSGSGVALVRGRFDAVKIEALMRERGGRVENYKGKRLVVGELREQKPSLSLAFLEPGLIAVGSSNLVRTSVDLAGGGANVTSNENVMTLVRDLDSGNAWAAGRFDALMSQAALPAGVGDKLPAIEWFSASANVTSGVRGVIRAQTRDEESATSLRDLVRGVLAFAKLQASARPEFQLLIRSLELGGTGKTVTLSFDIPSEAFDALGSIARTSQPSAQR